MPENKLKKYCIYCKKDITDLVYDKGDTVQIDLISKIIQPVYKDCTPELENIHENYWEDDEIYE